VPLPNSTLETLPVTLNTLTLQAQLVSNFNISLLFLLLPIIVYGAYYNKSKKEYQDKRSSTLKLAHKALFEYGMTASLFVLSHFVVCLTMFVGFVRHSDELVLLVASCAVSLAVVVGLCTVFVYYHRRPEAYGGYVSAFNSDSYSQHHYYLVIGQRVLLSVLIVALNSLQFIGFVCAALPLASIVVIAVRRPFQHLYNTIRSILNEVCSLLILVVYAYLRMAVDYTQHSSIIVTIVPFFVLGVVVICLAVNVPFMVRYQRDKTTVK
jgi:hypothetical protein